MGEGNRVASVIMFTFTLKPGPHTHNLCEARPRLWLASWLAKALVGLFQGVDELCLQIM